MHDDLRERAHDVDATLRVGKGGIDAVADELRTQLDDRELVKVKFLRAARGSTTTESLAEDLADRVDGEVVESRGHTAVVHR